MITFKQFLSEATKPVDVDYLADYIKEHCADFLNESKGKNFLIRGLAKAGEKVMIVRVPDLAYDTAPVWKKKTYSDRRPRDVDDEMHEKFNAYFNERFNFKARSDKVMFAFGKSSRTSRLIDNGEYGKGYLVFPIGKIKYVWSPAVSDLYDVSSGLSFESDEELYEWLDKKAYQDRGLNKAIGTSKEIMIQCDSYLVVPLLFEKALKEKLLNA